MRKQNWSRRRSRNVKRAEARGPVSATFVLASILVTLASGRTNPADPDPRMVPPSNAVRGRLPSTPPTPVSEANKTFRVLDGFRMDLLAAEPLVASPVAMAYDENGQAYVCEMRDYPYTD